MGEDSRTRAMQELLTKEQFTRVSQSIMVTVAQSFIEEQTRLVQIPGSVKQPTRNEIKHRTDIVMNWFLVMRNEIGFSTARALDMLSEALRTELDGGNWTPPPVERAWGVKEPASV